MEPEGRKTVVGEAGPTLAELEELVPPKGARDEGWRDEALLRSLAKRIRPCDLDLLRAIGRYRGGRVPLTTIALVIGLSLDEARAGLKRLRDIGLVSERGTGSTTTWFVIPDDECRVVERLMALTEQARHQEPLHDR